MNLLATERETCVIDRATLIAPTNVSLPCTFHPKTKRGISMEQHQSVPRGGGDQHVFPEPRRPPPWKRNKMHGTTYRFQEGDAADGTSFVPFGPCRSTRQFPSSKTKHSTMNAGTENCTNMTKQEEDLTTRLFPSSLRPVSFK